MPRSLVAVLRVVGASGLTLDSFEFVEFFAIVKLLRDLAVGFFKV